MSKPVTPSGVRSVLAGDARWHVEATDCLAFLRGLPDDSVDVVFCSPPYTDARTYGEAKAARKSADWVVWLRPIVVEMCRVSKGLAFLNVSDQVRNFRYQNGPEWLHADLTRLDGLDAARPYAWVKSGPGFDSPGNGQPGSGGPHFQRNDWEPVYGYAAAGKLSPPHWSDNTAFGHKPLWDAGGSPTMRNRSGKRASGPTDGKIARLGTAEGQPDIANPGNVIRALVGGGHLGHPLAHEGDAPMPLALAERFVCWFCPPDGVVCDPFSGSGTTLHASILHGRRFVGCDVRESQVELCRRRADTVTPDLFAKV